MLQLALLLAVFSIECYVRVRLVRPMLRAKHVKTQMEHAAGGGQEVTNLFLVYFIYWFWGYKVKKKEKKKRVKIESKKN